LPASYLILLQVGFALPSNLAVQSGGLLHRRFTLIPTLPFRRGRDGLFLWHYPFLSINRKTSQHYTGTPYPTESGLSSPHTPSFEGQRAQSDHPPDYPRSKEEDTRLRVPIQEATAERAGNDGIGPLNVLEDLRGQFHVASAAGIAAVHTHQRHIFAVFHNAVIAG